MINFQYRYPGLDENEFVPTMTEGWPNDKYLINAFGQLKNKKTEKILTVDYSLEYPRYVTYDQGKYISRGVHVLVGDAFIINPDSTKYTQYHHINGNKLDFTLKNIQLIDSKSHAKITNSDRLGKQRGTKNLMYIKYSDQLFSIEEERHDYKYFKKRQLDRLYESIKERKQYLGGYWKIINIEVENYYSKFSLEERQGEVWKLDPSGFIMVSSLGVLWLKNMPYPTLGSNKNFNTKYPRRTIEICGKKKYVHVLVAETFILGREHLPEEKVDHIDTNTLNNSVLNLKVGSQKDNMNNLLTKEKLSKRIGFYNLKGELVKVFLSAREASREGFGDQSRISKCCKEEKYNITIKGYLCAYQDGTQDEVIKRKLDLLAKRKNKNK